MREKKTGTNDFARDRSNFGLVCKYHTWFNATPTEEALLDSRLQGKQIAFRIFLDMHSAKKTSQLF